MMNKNMKIYLMCIKNKNKDVEMKLMKKLNIVLNNGHRQEIMYVS